MKKSLLSAAMLMAGMGAWAQDAAFTEGEMQNLTDAATEITMVYSMAEWYPDLMSIPLGYPNADSEVYTNLYDCAQAASGSTDQTLYTNLSNALDAFYAEKDDIIMPEAGKAYRINAWWRDNKLPIFWNNASSNYIPSNADPNGTVFVCDKIGEQYLFVSDNGYYFGWEAEGKEKFTSNTFQDGQKFTVEKANLTKTAGEINDGLEIAELLGLFCLKANNNNYLMYNKSTSKYVNNIEGSKYYSDNAHTTFFTLTEVEYTTNQFTVKDEADLNGTHVATFIAPYATTLPDGYTAYTANSVNEETVNLVKLTGDIPANTAVVITGEPCENQKVSLSTTNPTTVVGNKLFGYTTDTTVDSKTDLEGAAYALGKGLSGAEFLKYTGTTYLAGKAYLDGPAADAAGARSLIFNFGGDTETAIESIQGAESADAVVYDLAGRRVQGAQKGLYIVNGKVVIK